MSPSRRQPAHRARPITVRTARAAWRYGAMSPSRRQPAPPRTPHRCTHRPCGMAVGRDVPIAPHRPVAVRPTRIPLPCPVVRSRDHAQPIAHYTRALPGRRDGRPPGLPARALPPLRPRNSHAIRRRTPWCGPVAVGRDVPIAPPRHRRGARLGIPRHRRVPLPCAPPGRRDGRPQPPVGAPHRP